ncbi:MAG: hypothetical protein HYT79_11810 [Elusimicrobia bacterium]|nr:hypothetical protein [Elusimicrobiota bacterium]
MIVFGVLGLLYASLGWIVTSIDIPENQPSVKSYAILLMYLFFIIALIIGILIRNRLVYVPAVAYSALILFVSIYYSVKDVLESLGFSPFFIGIILGVVLLFYLLKKEVRDCYLKNN